MKQFFLITLILLCGLTCKVSAKPISLEKAMQNVTSIAKKKLNGRHKALMKGDAQEMRLVRSGEADRVGYPLYYIFNIGDGQGYVIASGDDCIDAVLGFGDQGCVDADEIPDNMRWWLSEYERQMEYAIRHGLQIRSAVPEEVVEVAPLLTSKWGQRSPYNDLCPIGNSGERCPTGCIATAMAQIMFYHKWPEEGFGNHTYSSLVDETIPITQTADFAHTTYQWDLMRESYTGGEPDESRSAVATLLSHIGIALDMIYKGDGSSPTSSKEATVWKRFFKYKAKSLGDVNDADFSRIVCQELVELRPVFVCGSSPTNIAHAFVCDGFSDDGYFHFNWGWHSRYDGYYLLTDMVPTAGNDYSYNHRIVYGIAPYREPLSLKIHVSRPGTLSDIIGQEDIQHVSSLTVSGSLNGTDFLTLREMAGRDRYNNQTDGILVDLDLRDAHIVDGGGCYFETDDETYYKCQYGTKDDVFPDQSFMNTNLRSIKLPNSIKCIGRYAFIFCYNLTDVDFGSGVEAFDFSCFNYTSMTDLVVPDHVKSIGPYAFCNMAHLKNIVLGSGITTIGYRAFEKDDNIEHLCSRTSSPVTIGEDVFSDECYDHAVLHIAAGKASDYRQKAVWKEFKTIVEPTELNLSEEPAVINDTILIMSIKNLTDQDFFGRVSIQYLGYSYGPGNAIGNTTVSRSQVIQGNQVSTVAYPYLRSDPDEYIIRYQNAASDDWKMLYQYPSDDDTPVSPLDVHWAQTSPFNDNCPEVDGTKVAAGCGAVAVAQILSHYRMPEHGFGHTKYTVVKNGVEVDVDFDSTPIDWTHILGTYTSTASEREKSAVANLIYQVGAAMKMQYGSSSSPRNHASMMWGLQHYLHFSPQSRYRRRLYYSTAEWIEMLNSELEAGHPVFYRGDHTSATADLVGHMFVIDGKNDDGNYHFNFGHASLKQDKFTSLNIVNQRESTVIGDPSCVAYHHRQAMVTDFFPVAHLTEADYDAANVVLTQPIVINDDKTPRIFRAKGSIKVSFQFRYVSFNGGSIQYSLGFCRDGEMVVSPSFRTNTFVDGGGVSNVSRTFQLPSGLADGSYEMCLVSRTDDSAPWLRGWDCAPNSIPVTVDGDVLEFNIPSFHDATPQLQLEGSWSEMAVNDSRYAEFTISNPTDNNFEDSLKVVAKVSDTETVIGHDIYLPTSIYSGQSLTYRVPISDTDLSGIEIYYKGSATGEWLSLTNPAPDIIEGNEVNREEGVDVFTSDGVLAAHLSFAAVHDSYSFVLSRLPRGIYIIRDVSGVRKFAKRK